MWRGIEDIYQTKTGEEVPDFCFVTLSGTGEFAYLNLPKTDSKYMVSWGDARPKKSYEKVNDIIGFTYKHTDGSSFQYMLKQVKQEIDEGYPVVLGPLDMYYLFYYPKMYHRVHVPFHYIMAVGYDDENQSLDILDCGKSEVQTLSYELCEKMLATGAPTMGKKNGICRIRFQKTLPDLRTIAVKGLERKCNRVLHPPVHFMGIEGMRKLASEIDQWKDTLGEENYRKALRSACEFSGTAPNPPERLFGAPKDSMPHRGCRDKYSNLLCELDSRYQIPEWKQAAQYFKESGDIIQDITDSMVAYLLRKEKEPECYRERILRIAELEEKANQTILEGCKAIIG